jgi:hypothetical protein
MFRKYKQKILTIYKMALLIVKYIINCKITSYKKIKKMAKKLKSESKPRITRSTVTQGDDLNISYAASFGNISENAIYFIPDQEIKRPERKGRLPKDQPDVDDNKFTIDMDQLQGFLISVMEQKEFILGKNLYHKLKRMRDPISMLLLDFHDNIEMMNIDFSYIDVANEEGFISYLPIKKKDIGNEREVWKHPSRQKTKIGRLINSISNDRGIKFTQNEIDTFISRYRAIQKSDDSEQLEFADWRMVKGNEIIKWYNGVYYNRSIDGGDTLNKSCMRYEKCGNYLHVYTHTPNITLLTLINKENGRLLGRALVWNDILIDGVKSTFMDRIYCVEGALDELFKSYAEKRGWWYKQMQNAKPHTPITNGTIIKNAVIEAFIINDVNWSDWKNVRVPYLDTLKYFKYVESGNGILPRLTNDENKKYEDNWSYNHGGYCEECEGNGFYLRNYNDFYDDDEDNIDENNKDNDDNNKERIQCDYCKGSGRR